MITFRSKIPSRHRHAFMDGNAEEAQQILQRLHPDVILMDITLPGMDGLSLTQKLKLDVRVSDNPNVALTAPRLIRAALRCWEHTETVGQVAEGENTTRPGNGDCDFFENPDLDSRSAIPVWMPVPPSVAQLLHDGYSIHIRVASECYPIELTIPSELADGHPFSFRVALGAFLLAPALRIGTAMPSRSTPTSPIPMFT